MKTYKRKERKKELILVGDEMKTESSGDAEIGGKESKK